MRKRFFLIASLINILLLAGVFPPAHATVAASGSDFLLPWGGVENPRFYVGGPHTTCQQGLQCGTGSTKSAIDFSGGAYEVLAIEAGTVVYTGQVNDHLPVSDTSSGSWSGNVVVIAYDNDVQSEYWYLDSIEPTLNVGLQIPRGYPLGHPGCTGDGAKNPVGDKNGACINRLHLDFRQGGTRTVNGDWNRGTPVDVTTITLDGWSIHAATTGGTDGQGAYAGTMTKSGQPTRTASTNWTPCTNPATGQPDPNGCDGTRNDLNSSNVASTIRSLNIGAVTGDFFTNQTDSGAFTAKPSDPIVFSQAFPIVNFNPPVGTVICSNSINADPSTRPFTDVVPQPDGTCLTIPAEGNGKQAGVGDLDVFNAVFRGSLVIGEASQVTFSFFSDDGWILGVGPNSSGAQPSYVKGPDVNPPSISPFEGYPIVGSYNTDSDPTQNDLVVNFPAAGTYPFELDYSECCAGRLALTLKANSQPIPQSASISGTVYQNSKTPANILPAAYVQVCSTTNVCSSTRTDASGKYTVSGLSAGQYSIKAFPPDGTNLLPGTLGPIVLTQSALKGQDIVLTAPTPPPPGTPPPTSGPPVVYQGEPITLNTSGCAGGQATYQILQDGAIVLSGPMTEGPTGVYSATVVLPESVQGDVQVIYTITCLDDSHSNEQFDIYISPGGTVQTTRGAPIAGAIVTLYRSDNPSGPFDIVPNGSGVMSVANRQNPDLTDAAGRFGWDVSAGYYKVRASKVGCVSPDNSSQNFVESDVLAAPPQVTDMTLVLACSNLIYLPITQN